MAVEQQEYVHSRPVVCKTIAAVAVTANTPVAVWTPVAGNKFRLLGFVVSLNQDRLFGRREGNPFLAGSVPFIA